MEHHFNSTEFSNPDFSIFSTVEGINLALSILGDKYTRRFLEVEAPQHLPGVHVYGMAQRALFRFDPSVIGIWDSDTPAQITEGYRKALTASPTYSVVGETDNDEFRELIRLAQSYAQSIIEPELRPAVQEWRRTHPEQLHVHDVSSVLIPFPFTKFRKVKPRHV